MWTPWQSMQTGLFVSWSGAIRSKMLTVVPWKSEIYNRGASLYWPGFGKRDVPGRAGAIVDHDLLAERLREFRLHDATDEVRRPARCE